MSDEYFPLPEPRGVGGTTTTPPAVENGYFPLPEPKAVSTGVVNADGNAIGSFATGINRGLAAGFGAPVDLAAATLNLVPRGINTVAGTKIPLIQNPMGGSQSIANMIGSVVGETNPVTPLDRTLAAAGGGIGSTTANLMGGYGAKSAGLLSKMLEPLFPETTTAQTLAPIAYGAPAGVGSELGRNTAANYTDNPYVKEIGGLLGGLGLTAGAQSVNPVRFMGKPNNLTQEQQVGQILGKSVLPDEGPVFYTTARTPGTTVHGDEQPAISGDPFLIPGQLMPLRQEPPQFTPPETSYPPPSFIPGRAEQLLNETPPVTSPRGQLIQKGIGWGGGIAADALLDHFFGNFGPVGLIAGKMLTDKAVEHATPYLQGAERLLRPGNDTARRGLLQRALDDPYYAETLMNQAPISTGVPDPLAAWKRSLIGLR